MPVAVRSSSTAALNSVGTSVTVNKPSGTVAGDLLVALASSKAGAANIISAPAGWTALDETAAAAGYGTGYVSSRAFYRVATSEANTYEFSQTVSEKMAALVIRIDGQHASTPINAYAVDSNSSSSETESVAPAVTTTAQSCLILSLHGNRAVSAPVDGSPPAGMSQIDIAERSFSAAAAAARETQAIAGTTGTRSWSLDAAARWTAWTVAIAPATGVGSNGVGGSSQGGRPPIKRGLYLKSAEHDETGIPPASFWTKANASSRIRGACPIIFWSNIETAFDIYDFSVIDSAIAEANAIGKELMLELRVHSFGTSAEDPSTLGVPQYLYTDSKYGGVAGAYGLARKHKNQYSVRLWDANVMDRVANLYEKVLIYCGGKLPAVVFTNESTVGAIDRNNPDAADYTVAKMMAQYKILIERATAAAGSDTRFCFVGNFIKLGDNGAGGDLDAAYDACVDNDAGWSSADPLALEKPISGDWGDRYRMQTQSLGGSGSTTNPAVGSVPPIPYMPLGEQGAGAFTDLSGYLTEGRNLLDFMLYHIEHCRAECLVVTENYKSSNEYKAGRLGYAEIVSLIDDTAVPAAERATLQAWAEAADSRGGVTGVAAQSLPRLAQSSSGNRGNAGVSRLPLLTQATTGASASFNGVSLQDMPRLTQGMAGTAGATENLAAQVLMRPSASAAGRTFYWAQVVPGTETWRVR